jgi:hypothetical protein
MQRAETKNESFYIKWLKKILFETNKKIIITKYDNHQDDSRGRYAECRGDLAVTVILTTLMGRHFDFLNKTLKPFFNVLIIPRTHLQQIIINTA